MTNREYAKTNQLFTQACELADTKATTRQASKWRMTRGLAYRQQAAALRVLDAENDAQEAAS